MARLTTIFSYLCASECRAGTGTRNRRHVLARGHRGTGFTIRGRLNRLSACAQMGSSESSSGESLARRYQDMAEFSTQQAVSGRARVRAQNALRI